jgi:hypothetical protein
VAASSLGSQNTHLFDHVRQPLRRANNSLVVISQEIPTMRQQDARYLSRAVQVKPFSPVDQIHDPYSART